MCFAYETNYFNLLRRGGGILFHPARISQRRSSLVQISVLWDEIEIENEKQFGISRLTFGLEKMWRPAAPPTYGRQFWTDSGKVVFNSYQPHSDDSNGTALLLGSNPYATGVRSRSAFIFIENPALFRARQTVFYDLRTLFRPYLTVHLAVNL